VGGETVVELAAIAYALAFNSKSISTHQLLCSGLGDMTGLLL
jgi:hypothetical protein